MDILQSMSSPSLDEALRVIKPRTEELIYDNGNSKGPSKALWDLMQIPTPQQLAYYRELNRDALGRYERRFGMFIARFSGSLEQCDAIFSVFPKIVDDGIRSIIEAAVRVGKNTHVCTTTTNSFGDHDNAIDIDKSALVKLLDYIDQNKALTHELLNALSHLPASSVSPLDLAKCSLRSHNWHGIWYLLTKDGNIGINGTLPSEIWNFKFALDFIAHDGSPPLALLHERPSALNVFKMRPYLTTFVVIADGLRYAARRLSSMGLLDPNLPALVNRDGVDVLSGLDRSGIPNWPLRMAANLCSDPDIIRSLCRAGAYLGGDDEALFSDLEVCKTIMTRSNSQARPIYYDTIASVSTALNHPKSSADQSMVPQAFISTDVQQLSLQNYWSPDSYVYGLPFGLELHFDLEWKPQVLAILSETQAERNLHAWLQRNATITDALS